MRANPSGAIVGTPAGSDSGIQTREIVFEADLSLDTPFRELGSVSRGGTERTRLNGALVAK